MLTRSTALSQSVRGRTKEAALTSGYVARVTMFLPFSDDEAYSEVVPEQVAGDLRDSERSPYNERACSHQSLRGHLYKETVVKTDVRCRTGVEPGEWELKQSMDGFLLPGADKQFHVHHSRSSKSIYGTFALRRVPAPQGYSDGFILISYWTRVDPKTTNSIRNVTGYYLNASAIVCNFSIPYDVNVYGVSDLDDLLALASARLEQLSNKLYSPILYGEPDAEIGHLTREAVTDKEVADLLAYYKWLSSCRFPFKDHQLRWGQVCQRAIEGAHSLDINSIAYLRDLPSLFGEVKAAAKLLTNPKNPSNWASLYLSYKYGTRLTVSDSREILKLLGRAPAPLKHAVCRGRDIRTLTAGNLKAKETLAYKVFYEPYDHPLAKFMKRAYDLDVWLSLQNAWDLVPFSFVVDWFISIEDILSSMDALAYTAYLTVLAVTRSRRLEVDLTDHQNRYHFHGIFASDLVYDNYIRQIRQTLDLPVPGAYVDTMEFPNHMAELTAIVVQLATR
jgi:hypothetical protein